MMNYKTLVAASLMSIALTSSAFAQCADCANYPDRDVLNNGAQSPAGKAGLMRPGGAAGSTANTANSQNSANSKNSANNARAEVRVQHLRRSGNRAK
jgi:hypothetical protein